ncbi:Aspartic proteinase nepenthesin-1 [Dichanthelium oligosanthes]|uniref:Aspartic proteinase nepenthesin-1 n=1 Tax=Dichanthelium oligosanthes TaxID=888268 RepID=A0A1E5W2U1_9POAL|nr:Aspartic proteinase nepenthesin-1 [Dichanthelium oligosanthes]
MKMGTVPLLWFALFCSSLAFTACGAAGIRLELTHVDAKANLTVEERMRRAMARTQHRLVASMDGTAPIHWATSQYIAEYRIGDPPQQAEAIIDTGSNLVWTQCSGCQPNNCFSQNLPNYDPSQSSTAQAVACGDAACSLGSETRCTSDGTACEVLTSYGAGTIFGQLGTEEFTFGSEEVTLAFGCITATRLTQGSLDGASGIIGLGRGGLSIVSQLSDTKFAYCLTPYFTNTVDPSHLFVGSSAGLSPNNAPVTSVPFVANPTDDPYNTFYYLPLTGITVGETMLDIPAGAFDLRQVGPGQWAGTLIDSGSPFTTLVDVAYQALRDELARQLGDSLVQPPSQRFDLCVARMDMSRLVPSLVLHFGSGGGDLVVPPENYWAPVDTTTSCLMVFQSPDTTTTIGNFMQQDMHLLYDLANGMLSFQTEDCSSM